MKNDLKCVLCVAKVLKSPLCSMCSISATVFPVLCVFHPMSSKGNMHNLPKGLPDVFMVLR